MINILINGCNGAMGRAISELALTDEDIHIVAGVDRENKKNYAYKVYINPSEVTEKVDAIIDVSHISAFDNIYEYSKNNQIPIVFCTTGLNAEQRERVGELSKHIPVLQSANMSLGINVLMKLISETTAILFDKGFDIEVVEKHHRRKLDAPSGTALALADTIKSQLNNDISYTYNRENRRLARPHNEIGISAIRGGTIVGEHEVIYAGEDEIISINHTALSRKIFAKGAIAAAIYISRKHAGLYHMRDVIRSN